MKEEIELPDFVQNAEGDLPGLCEEYLALAQLARPMLAARRPGELNDTILCLCGIAWQHYNAVITLLTSGFGVQGLILCRGIFELVVKALYLLKKPELHGAFIDYGKLLFYDHGLKVGLTRELQPVSAECERIKARFFQGGGRFNQWYGRKSIKELAKDVGFEPTYHTFYTEISGAVHADASMILVPDSSGRWRKTLKRFRWERERALAQSFAFFVTGHLFEQANKKLDLGHGSGNLAALLFQRAKAAARPNWPVTSPAAR